MRRGACVPGKDRLHPDVGPPYPGGGQACIPGLLAQRLAHQQLAMAEGHKGYNLNVGDAKARE
jgi:hypothetical protein